MTQRDQQPRQLVVILTHGAVTDIDVQRLADQWQSVLADPDTRVVIADDTVRDVKVIEINAEVKLSVEGAPEV